ncbi:MAG: helicase C-terminal domain-containing protein, partial [Lachnospiraceae bacterium]
EDYAVYAMSPFPRENRLLLVAGDVSSKYTRRNEREYEKILSYIRLLAAGKKGNYMVFFPSYQYMKAVADRLEAGAPVPFEYVLQSSFMNEAEREAFLQEFEKEREQSFVAFCVIGGVFSEGIDLKEERLIGAAIVGTGLPMVCTEQEVLKDYFDEKEQMGFDYAYQYPGMNKVMQAAGRVIRTVCDQGVILLLDERFLRSDYRSMFPREWEDYETVTLRQTECKIRQFWEERTC